MSASHLKVHILEDMRTAMKARDSKRLGVIRLLMAAIKQREVDERILLDDVQVLSVIDKMLRQRQESANQFKQAGRLDLSSQENFEMDVLKGYMPSPLSPAEIEMLVHEVIVNFKASSIKDMSVVMAQLKPKLQGRADMGAVSAAVKEKLSAKSDQS